MLSVPLLCPPPAKLQESQEGNAEDTRPCRFRWISASKRCHGVLQRREEVGRAVVVRSECASQGERGGGERSGRVRVGAGGRLAQPDTMYTHEHPRRHAHTWEVVSRHEL